MSHKTVYLWGPISGFAAPLVAWLINKGWHVHIACKPSFNLLSFSSLDLVSSARAYLEEAFGGHDSYRIFQDRIKLVESPEPGRNTKYDAFVFCGLPPNYDDARVPRAPWTPDELPRLAKALKGVPVFLVSSLWGAVQKDRVVPEELDFERRKPISSWERICQNYELKLLKALKKIEANWYFVRIPMLAGATTNGLPFSFTGPSHLFQELDIQQKQQFEQLAGTNIKPGILSNKTISLAYNPDATLWFLPINIAVLMFWHFLEDENRPRICNFISTQATLNREWLHHLGQTLGLKEIISSETDSLNLPVVLRKLLLDDVQVRTRNLFEVAGRYQLPPIKFDRAYFDKVIRAGRQKHWGRTNIIPSSSFQLSPQLLNYYFEQFVPPRMSENLLRKATKGNITLGIIIKDSPDLSWILTFANGKATVEKYKPDSGKPKLCFNLTGEMLTRLIQGKTPLHRALLLREVEVDGPLLDAVRVTQEIDRFLKDYSLSAQEVSNP